VSGVKITVQIGGVRHPAAPPFPEADHCAVNIACPACGAAAPLKVAGSGRFVDPDARHDTWAAEGYAQCCRANVGLIRMQVSTLFGIEEDEAVLRGRVRVY
jgi:hypothetical protein